ncbi:Putative protein in type-1 retrotransposable element R1DM [Araneus ventricosus]|uniref:Reverse transcriptase domain-containing protein n=1 Tax=Araneus ventricosus TaxID=182803 RepID=A0A4Y2CZ58_ARAVE|nr:Putative protein in type-1 retrotransposable element R1DM [Araneus ventricosus]
MFTDAIESRHNCPIPQKKGKPKSETKSYRPVSLLPTLGKILEKLLLERLNFPFWTNNLQAANKYGFTVNKSSEGAIVDFIDETEMTRSTKQHALVISLDIKGRQVALNTPQGPATLPQHGGCPQGSCTDPAFWNLVANEVLAQSWPEGVHLQAFADDFIFLIKALTKAKVKSLANEALNQFKSWTAKHNLEISADKSNYMHFNKNRNGPRWSAGIRWEGNLLKRKLSIKYQGVFIDDKLNFATHLSELKNKTLNLYQKIKSIAASNWGLNKNIRRKIYFTVIERILLYGVPAWANNITSRQQRLLNSIQRKFLLNITGAYSTSPTTALQVIEGITPLHIKAQMESILVRVGRLRRDCNWEGSSFFKSGFSATKFSSYHSSS